MTASITFGPRHPAYMAGYTWAENPTAPGCPYERGTDDYAMWQMGMEDARGREAALREAARELIEAGKLARNWLANSIPACDMDGPYPVPKLTAAIAKMEKVL